MIGRDGAEARAAGHLAEAVGIGRLAGSTLDLPIATVMALGCAAGAAIRHNLPRITLGRGFATLVITVAAWLFISTAFLGGPTT